MAQFVLDVNLQIQKVLGLEEVKAQLSSVAGSTKVNISAAGAGATANALGATQIAAVGATQAVSQFTQATNKVAAAATTTGAAVSAGAGLFDNYANRVALAGARYSAFVVATAVPFAGLAVIGSAVQSIIEMDAAMIKLTQILRQPKEEIDALRQEIIKLSTDTGTSIKLISESALTLAQAGFLQGPQDFAKFLEPLSKIPLLPTFKDINQATEGVIAGLGQFAKAGLEPIDILDKLTRVADKFAVESADLISALQRSGGTFSQLGGNIDEFLAIFTTIRQTTRESAESIATALKTISVRLSTPETVTFLEGLGVAVRNSKGELLGLIDIFKNLSAIFQASGKEQQAAIGKQLGGIRNVGRVFAALNNTKLIEDVLATSQTSAGAVEASATKALEKISVQIDLLVARFNALAQSLAEPIFVPLIHDALLFANAMITVIDAIKPVLPLLTELIGLAVGLKIFNFAASSVGGFVKALGGLNIGGFAGLSGVFGGQGTLPSAQPTFGQQAKGFAGSQVGQLAGLLAINLIAGKVADSFSKTNDSVIKLGANAAQTATIVLGLASILSGKSLFDLFKGLGLLGGTLLGLGAIGVGVVSAITGQNAINIDELTQKAAKEINGLSIEISPGSQKDLEDAVSLLTGPIGRTFSDIANQFDPGTFKGLVSGFSESLKSFFTGDFSKGLGLNPSDIVKGNVVVSTDQANEILKTIIGNNPAILSKIIKESIIEFGSNFQEGLQKNLEKVLAPFADVINVKDLANKIREQVNKLTGGFKGETNLRAEAEKEIANRLLAENTRKIAADLKSIIIPSELGGELRKLTEVVMMTVNSIESSVSSFEGLVGTIGKIETPQLPTTVTEEAVRKGITTGGTGFLNNITGTGFEQLSTATQQFVVIQKAIKDFTSGLELTLGKTIQELPAGETVNAEDIVKSFTDKFLEGVGKDLPDTAKAAIENASTTIAAKLDEELASSKFGIGFEGTAGAMGKKISSEIDMLIKSVFGNISEASDEAIKEIQTLLNARLKLTNTQIKFGDIEGQINALESIRPATIFQNLIENLDKLGIISANTSKFLGGTAEDLGSFGADVELSRKVLEELTPALQAQDDIYAKLQTSTRTNAADVGTLTDQYIAQSDKVRIIKETLAELGKAADIAGSQIPEATKKLEETGAGPQQVKAFQIQQEDIVNTVKETVGIAAKLIELNQAAQSSNIFVSAQERFSQSVDMFGHSIEVLGSQQLTNQQTGFQPGSPFSNAVTPGSTGFRALPNGQVIPENQTPEVAQKLSDITTTIDQIFKDQLQQQRGVVQNTSDVFKAITLIPDVIKNFITGTKQPIATVPATPFDQNQLQQALDATFKQIVENNKINASNPLSFLGTNLEDIKKNLQISIAPDQLDKLNIGLKPEAQRILESLNNGIPISPETQAPTNFISPASQELLNRIQNGLPPKVVPQSSPLPGTDLGVSFINLDDASKAFVQGTDIFTGAINQLVNATIPLNNPIESVAPATQNAQSTTETNNTFLADISNKVAELVASIQSNLEQKQTDNKNINKEDPTDELLASSAEATSQNTETLTGATEGMVDLSTQLADTSTALKEGLNMKLESIQQVNVDVTGVSEEVAHLEEKMAVVAREIARELINQAMSQLAAAAGSSEDAERFNSSQV